MFSTFLPPAALRAFLRATRYFRAPTNTIVLGGEHAPLGGPQLPHVVCFDEQGGQTIPRKNHKGRICYSRKRRGPSQEPIKAIVIHWGGFDLDHCRKALMNQGISSHGGIGPDGVEQWLDLEYQAFHAGNPANNWSVGFDICQSPRVEYLNETLRRGFKVKVEDNPTDRGPKEIVTLDVRVVNVARAFFPSLAQTLGIPLRVPRKEDGTVDHGVIDLDEFLEGGGGILGHHHLTSRKWDIACWWEQVFKGTPLG